MPRLGLLAKFALLSLVLVALLGVALGAALRTMIRERSLANVEQTAEVVTRLEVQSRLSPADLEAGGLTAGRARELDAVLEAANGNTGIAAVKIWNHDRKVVYSNLPNLTGDYSAAGVALTDDLQDALNGTVAAEILEGHMSRDREDDPGTAELLARHGQLLEVYVPICFAAGSPPAGAFELYLPYRPVAAQIAHDTRDVSLLLLAGLAMLYAGLFRIVAAASRRLRRQVAENLHQATHDALTGLPNRELLRDQVREAILAAERDHASIALLLIDLDHFKEVNDTLGHVNGDGLLRQIAARLPEVLGAAGTVARLGGDEFAALLPRIVDVADATAAAERLAVALAQPFVVGDLTLGVAASIGVAVFPEHCGDADTLLQFAEVAMYAAKQRHLGPTVYAPELNRHSPSRLALLGQLRRGIERDELVLHYQPKVDLASGRVVGVEALVRWQHPDLGLLAPDRFIPLAERTGLIEPLTSYVLAAALRQARIWQRWGFQLPVAVNVSASSVLDPNFPVEVAGLLEAWQATPALLELEITESSIMDDPARALEVLGQLDAMGVGLAIDDFGTGYSSMAYLKQLPVHELKIDRSFITDMATSGNDVAIVRSTIELARNLGLRVVAEGVETAAVWTELRSLGCDVGQGFHFCRPVPAEDLTVWLRSRLPIGVA